MILGNGSKTFFLVLAVLWSLLGETQVVNGKSTGRGVRRMGSLPFKPAFTSFGELRVVSLLSDDNSCSPVWSRGSREVLHEDPTLPPLHLPFYSTPSSQEALSYVSPSRGSNRGCFPTAFSSHSPPTFLFSSLHPSFSQNVLPLKVLAHGWPTKKLNSMFRLTAELPLLSGRFLAFNEGRIWS